MPIAAEIHWYCERLYFGEESGKEKSVKSAVSFGREHLTTKDDIGSAPSLWVGPWAHQRTYCTHVGVPLQWWCMLGSVVASDVVSARRGQEGVSFRPMP